MIIEGVKLAISRVEIVKKVYDKQGRVITESVEFWYPEEDNKLIGFKCSKPLEKK